MKFSNKVLNLCKQIPKGKVTTYKEIAIALNSKAYQGVGNALRNNPYPIKIPCHRVVNSDGKIGGYSGKKDNPKKKTLLKKEGIIIVEDKIDLKEFLYNF